MLRKLRFETRTAGPVSGPPHLKEAANEKEEREQSHSQGQ